MLNSFGSSNTPIQQNPPAFAAPQDQQMGGRGGYRGGRGRGGGGGGGRGGGPGGQSGPKVCFNSSKPGGCYKTDCHFFHPPGTHNPKP